MSEIAVLMDRLAQGEGLTETPLPGVRLHRRSEGIARCPLLYQQGLIIVGQGAKRVHLGGQTLVYDADHYLVLSVPLPVECEAVVHPDEPLLSLTVDIDMLCDGAPGIGCPVISSLSGASRAVIVTEPTPSGRHDLLRVAELCRHFGIPAAVLVNKFDLNPAGGEEIESLCRERGLDPLGRLPHDEAVARAMARGLCVAELPEASISRALRDAWERLCALPDKPAARPDPFHTKPS